MTAPDYADLRRLLAEGTPGPWRLGDSRAEVWADRDAAGWDAFMVASSLTRLNPAGGTVAEADAHLIVAAVNALPALLDEREALIREQDGLRAKVEAVERLADEWERTHRDQLPHLGCLDMYAHCSARIRAALADGGTP